MVTKSSLKSVLAAANKVNTVPHLIIEARAGTGKTTTMIEGLKFIKGLPTKITPSDEQKAVWDSMKLSSSAQSIKMVAFNKSIATELQERVPAGVTACTMHSLGNSCLFQLGRFKIEGSRTVYTISRILGMELKEIRKQDPALLNVTERLVSLVKLNLLHDFANGVEDTLDTLMDTFGLEVEDKTTLSKIYDLVPKIIEAHADPKTDGQINFDDMIWIPIVNNLKIPQVDVLFVDEAQDLNPCQQELAIRAGKRLIFCGDPKQAIYGFAGADSASMSNLYNRLKASPTGCDVLPLVTTRRCGKAIVKKACEYVAGFKAHESNCEGSVEIGVWPMKEQLGKKRQPDYLDSALPMDMVVCRTNAPLISQAFAAIRRGRPAIIIGRDIGAGLITIVNKQKANTVEQLEIALEAWVGKETEKEMNKKIPSESKLQAIDDKYQCLLVFLEGANTVQHVIDRINSMFSDAPTNSQIRFSTVHKAKGLEAESVYFLKPKSKFFKEDAKDWEAEQERNLEYVAITRAIQKLTYVFEKSV